MGKRIAVLSQDTGISVHAASSLAGYATLCGLSIDDDEETGREVPLPSRGAKVDCRACLETIRTAKTFRSNELQK